MTSLSFVIWFEKPVFQFTNFIGTVISGKCTKMLLAHRLRKMGLSVEQQFELPVYDEDGTILGKYKADLFVEQCLIVEVKAYRDLADENIAQLLGYLRSSKIEHGLLINFGSLKLQVRKYVLSNI
jgi:GxxExxY protein